jgi:hypothetical protein
MSAASTTRPALRGPRTAAFLPRSALGGALLAVLASAAAADVPAGAPVFTSPLEITNEFFPFEPGAVRLFIGRDDGARLAVVDLYREETRSFDVGGNPVECAILQETEFEDGSVVEISQNYFAQADDGTVYYFGEVVDIYEDGKVASHDGSWLVGGPTLETDPEDTATALVPAVFMPEEPEVGDSWKPEDLFPIVDETVTVLDEDVKVKVLAGTFEDTLKVEETSAISEGAGRKWYAPGVGLVLDKSTGSKLQLVASTLEAEEEEEGEED